MGSQVYWNTVMRYVRSDEGQSGLIRGEISYCSSAILYYVINHYVSTQLQRNDDSNQRLTLYDQCVDVLWTTAISSAVAVVLTHPFAVLSLRQMSQFVGKENIYSVAALKNLLMQPGLFALIDGLLPRYIYLTVPALVSKVIMRIYEFYLAGHIRWFPPNSSDDTVASNMYYRSDWVKWFIGFAAEHCVSDMLYPLEVVVVSTSVAKSGVVPGEYPFAPELSNWISRLKYMARHHQLRRKANLLKRVFTEHNDAFIVY
uniref:Mitochondrial carrier 2 n=1 Tax=Lygus hesperus TaxID=30085 RepID=A0A0A9Y1J2_LYGHE